MQLGWDSPLDEEQISILLLLDAVLKLNASKQTIKQFKVLVSCLLGCLRQENRKMTTQLLKKQLLYHC